MISHWVTRRGSKLRVVLELDLNEIVAHLESDQIFAKYRSRLGLYLDTVEKDIVEVAATIADEPENGVVKWFDDSKGYGFIRGRDSQDVFVHQKQISTDGYRTLKAGQVVRFKRRKGKETFEAIDVQPIGED